MARRRGQPGAARFPRWVREPRYSDFLTEDQVAAADGLAPYVALKAYSAALDDFFSPQGIDWQDLGLPLMYPENDLPDLVIGV